MYTLIINGQNLQELFGAFVTSWADDPPEPRTSYVEVPGRMGKVDLTDALTGWPVYGDRKIEAGLAAPVDGAKSEALAALSKLKQLVHGRRSRLEFTGDPGYTYTGRVSIGDVAYLSGAWTCTLTAECLPYRSRGTMTYHLDAACGKTVVVRSGAEPVCPTIECSGRTLVNVDGRTYEFGPGASQNLDLWLMGPATAMTINGTPDYGQAAWLNHLHRTWSEFAGMRLAHMASMASNPLASRTWASISGTWASLSGTWQQMAYVSYGEAWSWKPWTAFAGRQWQDLAGTWVENGHDLGAQPPRADTYISFEWGDL